MHDRVLGRRDDDLVGASTNLASKSTTMRSPLATDRRCAHATYRVAARAVRTAPERRRRRRRARRLAD